MLMNSGTESLLLTLLNYVMLGILKLGREQSTSFRCVPYQLNQ